MCDLWNGLRALSGDDAYERYLAHRQRNHAQAHDVPLDRQKFYQDEQKRKWEKPRRCC